MRDQRWIHVFLFRWKNGRLALMVSWVDDILAVGHPEVIQEMENDLKKAFVCKYKGELNKYIGCKADLSHDKNGLGMVNVTQPVLVQKLEESFDVAGGKNPKTTALVGQVLVRRDISGILGSVKTTKFRSGTANFLFMTQWSRPEIFNTTQG